MSNQSASFKDACETIRYVAPFKYVTYTVHTSDSEIIEQCRARSIYEKEHDVNHFLNFPEEGDGFITFDLRCLDLKAGIFSSIHLDTEHECPDGNGWEKISQLDVCMHFNNPYTTQCVYEAFLNENPEKAHYFNVKMDGQDVTVTVKDTKSAYRIESTQSDGRSKAFDDKIGHPQQEPYENPGLKTAVVTTVAFICFMTLVAQCIAG